jgi:hypothetical protein
MVGYGRQDGRQYGRQNGQKWSTKLTDNEIDKLVRKRYLTRALVYREIGFETRHIRYITCTFGTVLSSQA